MNQQHNDTMTLYSKEDMLLAGEIEFMNDPSSKEFRAFENALANYHIKHIIIAEYFEELKARSAALLDQIESGIQ